GFAYISLVEIENDPEGVSGGHTVQFRRVSAGYFSTMRIRVRAGRVFDRTDSLSSTPTVVVSQSFVDRFFRGADPIGRRVKRGAGWTTIVGVVDDVNDVDVLQPAQPTLYAAWSQTANVAFPMALLLRTRGDPNALAHPLGDVVRGIDPLLALD